MSKFEVGDRVAMYNTAGRKTGTVQKLTCDGLPMVQEDGPFGGYMVWHPKQCRHLRKPSPARTWKLGQKPGHPHGITGVVSGPMLKLGETVEVREVRRKRKDA